MTWQRIQGWVNDGLGKSTWLNLEWLVKRVFKGLTKSDYKSKQPKSLVDHDYEPKEYSYCDSRH